MNFTIKKGLMGIAVLGMALGACQVTKPYQKPELSEQNQSKLYRDVATTDTTTLADIPWKTLFADQQLQTLIEEGLANNLDLKIAVERIGAAEASFKSSKAALWPSLNFAPTVIHNKSSQAALNFPAGVNINLKTTTYQLPLSTNWEIDIWGKLARAKRSALATLLQTEASKRAVQTQLIARIANNYYALLALDKQLTLTLEAIEIRRKDVEAMRELKNAGMVNGAAVVQSEANLYSAEVSLPDLKQSIRELEHMITILLGKEPGSIQRTTFEEQAVYTDLQTGIPAQLLHNRPDVEAAEFAFRSSFEATNVARTYFYPTLAVTAGSGGFSSLHLTDYFTNSIFYSITGSLTQPIFNKGQNRARLKTSLAQQQQALYTFQQTLLTAGQEVSNALFAYQMVVEKEATRTQQLASLEKAVEFNKELLQYSSSTNYTDVLTSEQSLLAAQLAGVNDRLQQLQAVVELYRALGGGWKN